MAFVVVEGNIGAGKSTFLNVVKKYLDVQIVFEPRYKWQNIKGNNLLDFFYKDGKRWAYTFQAYAFITRVIEQEEKAKKNTKSFQFIERSVYSDRYCFAKNAFYTGKMSKLEWELYKEWFAWFVENRLEQPSGFIYLRAEPEVCYKRLIKHNRLEEAEVKLEYLKLLHNKHEDWLVHKRDVTKKLESTPVLILDCNESFEFDFELQRKYIRKLVEFLESNFGIPFGTAVLPQVNLLGG